MKVERMKNSKRRLVITAIELVAEMFEYAKCYYKLDCGKFFTLLNSSYISDKIYKLDMIYVYGKSSIELVSEICGTQGIKISKSKGKTLINPSYYWLGIIVASYCFGKSISFKEFEERININDLLKLYGVMHEAPQMRMIDEIDSILSRQESSLARIRRTKNISQKELSIMSNVSLRSIQMYEQRQKSISKASFETIRNLAKSLSVDIDELYDSSDAGNGNIIIMY